MMPERSHPGAAVLPVELEGGDDQQDAREQRPGRRHEHERENRADREHEGRDPDEDVDHALGQQQSPALVSLRRPDRRNDGERAVDKEVGGKEERQRDQDGTGGHEGHDPEQDGEQAAQRKRPPVLCQDGAHAVVAVTQGRVR